MRDIIFILLLTGVTSAFAGGASFSKSKKILAKQVYADH